jgi:hypothetical protein
MEVNRIVDYRRWSIYAVDFEGDAPRLSRCSLCSDAGGYGSLG